MERSFLFVAAKKLPNRIPRFSSKTVPQVQQQQASGLNIALDNIYSRSVITFSCLKKVN